MRMSDQFFFIFGLYENSLFFFCLIYFKFQTSPALISSFNHVRSSRLEIFGNGLYHRAFGLNVRLSVLSLVKKPKLVAPS